MSATLGDVGFFAEDLTRRTGEPVAVVTTIERPVPLTFTYAVEPLHELLDELVQTHRAPVYVVHFTQAAAVERAQSLLSTPLASRAERDLIAAELGDFRFTSGFGRTLSKLLRHGIGVHHAGMLPGTGASSSASRRRGSSRSCAGPTRWAWASTCRSEPSCSRPW
ncbi:hypothetical protein LJB74_16390 [Cellulomonas sp. P24]|nr:hypothetical protein [Cellulomonas sp. P24]